MTNCYIEFRKQAARGSDSLMADVTRHMHTRQHLGKTVVISDTAIIALSAARKQWLRLARSAQKQRASTLNADKILKYTHTITHMQHLRFSSRSPLDQPDSDVYFLRPKQISIMPARCYTVYVVSEIDPLLAATIADQLPHDALVVDYVHNTAWEKLALEPKKILEARVETEWRQVKQFLQAYHIDITNLNTGGLRNVEAMDDALDTLLGISHKFLRLAQEFQHALELARPLRLTKDVREYYDSFMLMAHRVQALTPGAFTQQFLETYNEDDTFFLYDVARRRFVASAESLAEAFARHLHAGRPNLARAIQQAVAMRS